MRETTSARSSGWASTALLGLGLAVCGSAESSAAPVTFEFTGTVVSLDAGPNAGIAVGMPVSGLYTFEGATTASCAGSGCGYADAVSAFSLEVPAASLVLAEDPLGAGGSTISVSTGSRVCGLFYTYCHYRRYSVSVSTASGGFMLERLDDHPPDYSLALPLVPRGPGLATVSVSLTDGSVFRASATLMLMDPSGDYDGDGIPTASDNCPFDANPLQEDADSDLLGDVCDPFANAPNNEQAQCLVDLGTANAGLFQARIDLAQVQADLGDCRATRVFADSDGDGEDDATDQCAATPAGSPVDAGGCSLAQFCATRAATCKTNDWLNDEPGVKRPRDCVCN